VFRKVPRKGRGGKINKRKAKPIDHSFGGTKTKGVEERKGPLREEAKNTPEIASGGGK